MTDPTASPETVPSDAAPAEPAPLLRPPAPPAEEPARAASPIAPPRTRWAGIVWGLLFAALAAISLWILASAERRDVVTVWAREVDATTVLVILLLGVGVLLLVGGLAGLLRRAQRGHR